MAFESIAQSASWFIDSEPIRARGIILNNSLDNSTEEIAKVGHPTGLILTPIAVCLPTFVYSVLPKFSSAGKGPFMDGKPKNIILYFSRGKGGGGGGGGGGSSMKTKSGAAAVE